MKKISLIILVAVLLMPLIASAGITGPSYEDMKRIVCDANNRGPFDPGCVDDLETEAGLLGMLLKFVWLLRTIFWILAVAMLLLAAYKYLLAGAGGKADDAKNMIQYAVYAMILALVATSIPYLIKSIIQ